MNHEEFHAQFLKSLDVSIGIIRDVVENSQEEKDSKRLLVLASLQATFDVLSVYTDDEELKKRLLLLVELINKI